MAESSRNKYRICKRWPVFKDFLGEGQHITKNKDFENDVKIGQMRKFYKQYTPKEISSILSKAF